MLAHAPFFISSLLGLVATIGKQYRSGFQTRQEFAGKLIAVNLNGASWANAGSAAW
jgi:hypothetical protein